MTQFNVVNLRHLQKILMEDEFDDSVQNEEYGGVSGEEILIADFNRFAELDLTLDVGCGSGELFDKLPITHAIDPNNKREGKALKKMVEELKQTGITNIILGPGWAESIPYNDRKFANVVCWGTACFFRSPMEAYMEINRVLFLGGHLFFDVVTRTTMPIAQTVGGPSFIKHIQLYGFEIVSQTIFGPDYHRRLALVVMKTRDFDPKYFRMPQCVGEVNNYVEDRDWYLR